MLETDRKSCFSSRLVAAESMVESGAWASGHAVAEGLMTCSRHAGCDRRADCAAAAGTLIGVIRRRLCETA